MHQYIQICCKLFENYFNLTFLITSKQPLHDLGHFKIDLPNMWLDFRKTDSNHTLEALK